MKTFKVGQIVYYYYECPDFMGHIVSARITSATKNLSTGRISYKVSSNDSSSNWWLHEREIDGAYLYSSRKQIIKEYKEELVYNELYKELKETKDLLCKVLNKVKDKEETQKWGDILPGKVISLSPNAGLIVEGIGDIRDKIAELEDRIKVVEKKIKPKTRKKVVKKEEETEAKTEESK